jgi:hypothetical protein
MRRRFARFGTEAMRKIKLRPVSKEAKLGWKQAGWESIPNPYLMDQDDQYEQSEKII